MKIIQISSGLFTHEISVMITDAIAAALKLRLCMLVVSVWLLWNKKRDFQFSELNSTTVSLL